MPFFTWRSPVRWVPCLVLASLFSAIGCAGGSGTISGTVSVKGVPLKGGNVAFLNDNGQSRLAEIKEDGSYTIDKCPVGQAMIGVETDSLRPQSHRNYLPKDAKGGPKLLDAEEAKRRYVPIPLKYKTPDRSGLTYEVKRGKQEHNIELDDIGPTAEK